MPEAAAALLISLKPRFAEMILSGEKVVELRRVRPAIEVGTPVLFYASSPKRAILGQATVRRVTADSPAAIWAEFGPRTGLTKFEFDAYFKGANQAAALELSGIERLRRPITLTDLRQRWVGFRPPQSFRYLDRHQVLMVSD